MPSMTSNRVRPLSLDDLGIELDAEEHAAVPETAIFEPLLPEDPTLVEVKAAIELGFAGVILAGPPGTGKSWYAKRIAQTISGNPENVRIVQFHASYQYEDFMEGFMPKDGGGFELHKKVFPLLCDDAAELPDETFVLVIDEISRCDVARVFGEALTYMEVDKRGLPCTMASGSTLVVPANLIILATMNPWDKGVDEMDVALERRFAQIDMPPSVAALRKILQGNGADGTFVDRVATFFDGVLKIEDEAVHLGHAYFNNCLDETSARRVWDYRLLPFFKKACRLDRDLLQRIRRMWLNVVPEAQQQAPAQAAPEGDVADQPTVEADQAV
ncbi:AAA domain-containing protein [Sinorhizobium meliloti]|nr:ATPase associated with various cellular activities AAA_5 [Sinorhizobium meliloti BL225C]MDE3757887.1 AAA family ATPase [Sinorhizobium meliloti]MDW9905915.1 AAA domain-containing protein [Sinorhizobium meliloti]RVL42478.1 AAA family ATPase [Sinorhizobium meliloti]RVM74362.1 AAA family ATPase [Sinorhizobium meliloti]